MGLVDFGNGIVAGGTSRDAVKISDHDGMEYPLTEVFHREYGNLSGGVYVSTRARTRLMTVYLTAQMPRRGIAQAFSPGVVRTISTERGQMPYVVEALVFQTPNIAAPIQRFSVAMRSPDAYPTSGYFVEQAGSSDKMEWPHEYPHEYERMDAITELRVDNPSSITAEPIMTITGSGTLTITHRDGSLTVGFADGHTLVVDSVLRMVTIDGESALPDLLPGSVFPTLHPGSNLFLFSLPVTVVVGYKTSEMGLL